MKKIESNHIFIFISNFLSIISFFLSLAMLLYLVRTGLSDFGKDFWIIFIATTVCFFFSIRLRAKADCEDKGSGEIYEENRDN